MANNPLVIGHRGVAGEAPENTLGSFRLAVEQGCDGVELDIHLTRDGEIVVCHDPDLKRTTNGIGMIGEMSLAEVQSYDAGGWFSEEYRGEKVPLLKEVFDLLPPDMLINVELKYAYSGLEQKLIDLLVKSGRLDTVVVSSFDHKAVRRLKEMEPRLKIGLLYASNFIDHVGYADSVGVEVYSLHPHYHLIDCEDIRAARKAGYQVYPYTVNLQSDMKALIEAGVHGIITDFPNRLNEILKRKD